MTGSVLFQSVWVWVLVDLEYLFRFLWGRWECTTLGLWWLNSAKGFSFLPFFYPAQRTVGSKGLAELVHVLPCREKQNILAPNCHSTVTNNLLYFFRPLRKASWTLTRRGGSYCGVQIVVYSSYRAARLRAAMIFVYLSPQAPLREYSEYSFFQTNEIRINNVVSMCSMSSIVMFFNCNSSCAMI